MQVRLDPGDVLYLPARCWHAAQADGSSLALTLALGRITTMDLSSVLLSQATAQQVPLASVRLPPFACTAPDVGASRRTIGRARISGGRCARTNGREGTRDG